MAARLRREDPSAPRRSTRARALEKSALQQRHCTTAPLTMPAVARRKEGLVEALDERMGAPFFRPHTQRSAGAHQCKSSPPRNVVASTGEQLGRLALQRGRVDDHPMGKRRKRTWPHQDSLSISLMDWWPCCRGARAGRRGRTPAQAGNDERCPSLPPRNGAVLHMHTHAAGGHGWGPPAARPGGAVCAAAAQGRVGEAPQRHAARGAHHGHAGHAAQGAPAFLLLPALCSSTQIEPWCCGAVCACSKRP